MRIQYNSIGPVDKADVQLGRLTVICGNNNAGKTYLAYSLYGLLQYMYDSDILSEKAKNMKLASVKKSTVEKLNNDGNVTIELGRNELVRKSQLAIKQMSKEYSNIIHKTFNGDKDGFQGSHVTIEVDKETIKKHIDDKLQSTLEVVYRKDIKMRYDSDRQQLTIIKEHLENDTNKLVKQEEICEAIFMSLIFYQFPRPFITTSQRNGVSMFYKDLDLKRYLQVEGLVNPERPEIDKIDFEYLDNYVSRYSKPISDEINFVRKLGDYTSSNGRLSESEIAILVEQLVKITNADYNAGKIGINHVSSRKNKKRFHIPLHLASASSIELAELYFYIKHRARKDDLLIIDEPESHLSHINQIHLTRMLSMCVKYGIWVVITTHSDIILKEINNMFMYDKLPTKLRNQFNDQYRPEMSISKDALKAYWNIDGEARSCVINNWGLVIPNFDDAHFGLHDRAMKMYSLLGSMGYE